MPSIVSLIKEATTRHSIYIYILVFYLYVLYIVVCDRADRAHCLAVVLRSISVSRILMISPIRLPSLFREANTIKTNWKSHFGTCKSSQNKAALHLDSHLSNGDLCLLSVSVEVRNIYSIYSTVSESTRYESSKRFVQINLTAAFYWQKRLFLYFFLHTQLYKQCIYIHAQLGSSIFVAFSGPFLLTKLIRNANHGS